MHFPKLEVPTMGFWTWLFLGVPRHLILRAFWCSLVVYAPSLANFCVWRIERIEGPFWQCKLGQRILQQVHCDIILTHDMFCRINELFFIEIGFLLAFVVDHSRWCNLDLFIDLMMWVKSAFEQKTQSMYFWLKLKLVKCSSQKLFGDEF